MNTCLAHSQRAFTRKNLFLFIGLFCGSLCFFSCKNDGDPNVGDIKVNLNTRRLDKDFAALDTNKAGEGINKLNEKYPDFLSFYTDTLLNMGLNGNFSDSSIAVKQNLGSYLRHKDFRDLADTVSKVFPDTKNIDDALVKGFQHMKFYYPGYGVPKIVYFNSYLSKWNALTYGDSIVAIGLDMYLGPQYSNYPRVDIPDYIIRNLQPEAAPVNVFRSIYHKDHPFISEGRTLLDMMLQRGQEQYFLSKILPFVPEATRFGFTEDQLNWCRENESGIYNFFLKEKMLYDTNWQKILRYVTEGPSATGMSAESPGNVGSWLGLQMVEAYASTHPKATIDEIIKPQDAQAMLQAAKYKPGK